MFLIAFEDGVLPIIGAAVDPGFERRGPRRDLFSALNVSGANHKHNGDNGGKEKPPGMAHTGIYMVTRVKIGLTTLLPAWPAARSGRRAGRSRCSRGVRARPRRPRLNRRVSECQGPR